VINRIAAVLSLLFLSHAAFAAVPPDADIRAILVDRIDVQHQGVGIVVGVIDPSGRRVVAYGKTAKDGKPVDANTVFEIGSVTKVFTSLLLADMVQRGEVALTDPVSKSRPDMTPRCSRSQTGIFRHSPARARCGRPPTISSPSSARTSASSNRRSPRR